MKKIEAQIRHYRVKNNLKQSELAAMLGKSEGVISNWEKGINSPSVECVTHMLEIFKVDANTFFGWEAEPKREPSYSKEALCLAAAFDRATDHFKRSAWVMLEPFMTDVAAEFRPSYFDYTVGQINDIHEMARVQSELVKKTVGRSSVSSSKELGAALSRGTSKN